MVTSKSLGRKVVSLPPRIAKKDNTEERSKKCKNGIDPKQEVNPAPQMSCFFVPLLLGRAGSKGHKVEDKCTDWKDTHSKIKNGSPKHLAGKSWRRQRKRHATMQTYKANNCKNTYSRMTQPRHPTRNARETPFGRSMKENESTNIPK